MFIIQDIYSLACPLNHVHLLKQTVKGSFSRGRKEIKKGDVVENIGEVHMDLCRSVFDVNILFSAPL